MMTAKRWILTIGGILGVIGIPTTAVLVWWNISSSSTNNNNNIPHTSKNMNGVTAAMVKRAITIKIGIPKGQDVPERPQKDWDTTLDNIKDVDIAVSNWKANDQGSIVMKATLSKEDYNAVGPFDIKVDGYKSKETDQEKMDGIDIDMMTIAITDKVGKGVGQAVPSMPSIWFMTLNHLDGVGVTLSSWNVKNDGSVTMNANISKPGLTSHPQFVNIILTGYKVSNQEKMDGITVEMVKKAIIDNVGIGTGQTTPNMPTAWSTTLNHLDGVTITLSSWQPKDDGSVTMTAAISKTGFTAPPGSPFVGIKITGYKTADQIKMNGITADMVRTEIIKEVGVGTGQATPSMPNAWSTTLNHLDGVSIALSSWSVQNDGSVTMTAAISKGQLIAPLTSPFVGIKIEGYKTLAQQEMDGITVDMVKTAIIQQIGAPTGQDTPFMPSNWDHVLNHLNGVNIAISDWKTKDDGSVTMTATISKGGLTVPPGSPFVGIEITGYKTADQVKMDGITVEMVKKAITDKIGIGAGQKIPNKPNDWVTKLNHLDGVTVSLSNWAEHDDGSIVMNVNVTKAGLKAHSLFVAVTLTGFQTSDQAKMDGINADMVKKAITDKIGIGAGQQIPNRPGAWTATINHLAGVNIVLSDWTINGDGTIITTATISKSQLIPPKSPFSNILISGYQHDINILSSMPVPISTIPNVSYGFSQRLDATHYLIGTESKGVYQVAVDANGMVKTAVPVPLSTIPDTSYGFAQQIDATHYLIATKDNGIYQVTANLNGNGLVNSAVQSAPSVTTGIPSDLQDGFSQQIDPTHYLIGTHRNGVYEVIVDSNGMIQSSHHVFMSGTVSIPNVGSGWIQRINATHYLIGTNKKGIYTVEVDANGRVIKTIHDTLIGHTKYGWIQKINSTHYLIAIQGWGVYQVTLDSTDGHLIHATPVHTSGANSLPTGEEQGWGQKLDDAHYLIGTFDKGVYKVTVDPRTGIVRTSIRVDRSGTPDSIPDVGSGFAQKIDATHYLIGTVGNHGLYQIHISPLP